MKSMDLYIALIGFFLLFWSIAVIFFDYGGYIKYKFELGMLGFSISSLLLIYELLCFLTRGKINQLFNRAHVK
jgi:membrane protein implicated in regulation of membrane protease activity